MKKPLFLLLIILIVNLWSVSINSANKSTKNSAEIYITKIEAFIKKHPKILYCPENSPEMKELVGILDSTTEIKAIEAQLILTSVYDIQELSYKIQDPSSGINETEAVKYWVYGFIEGRLFNRWEKQFGNLEIVLMQKLFPIIKNKSYNVNIRKKYITEASVFMNDIHNGNIVFPDEHRNKLMDELINIFIQNKYQIKFRIDAAKTWVKYEKRTDIFWKKFEFIYNNPSLFEGVTYDMVFNMFINRDTVKKRMDNILDTDKSPEIIRGTLNYLSNWAFNNQIEEQKLKEKVKKLRQNEKNNKIIKIYDDFLRDN